MFRAKCLSLVRIEPQHTALRSLGSAGQEEAVLKAEIVKMTKKYAFFCYRKTTRTVVEQDWGVGKKLAVRRV